MKIFVSLFLLLPLLNSCANKQIESSTATGSAAPSVTIVGEMRNVMHKGELFGRIDLDTIANKNHLYAVAPLEYLKGEIMILDGVCYVSKALTDSTMFVEKTYQVKAPFFVSSNVETWHEIEVADSVQTLQQLELFLDIMTKNSQRPFAFKIEGTADSALIHVVDLPDGSVVKSPEDAHQNQKNYLITNSKVEIVGFFSTEHAGVFVHHDSFVHMHLINSDKTLMGHIDALKLSKGNFKLFLPQKPGQ